MPRYICICICVCVCVWYYQRNYIYLVLFILPCSFLTGTMWNHAKVSQCKRGKTSKSFFEALSSWSTKKRGLANHFPLIKLLKTSDSLLRLPDFPYQSHSLQIQWSAIKWKLPIQYVLLFFFCFFRRQGWWGRQRKEELAKRAII